MGAGPIFIGGLSFSGKTLLRLMLTAHPNIAITRRTAMWTRFYKRYGDLGQADNFERCMNAMLRNHHVRALGPDPDRLRREFQQGPPTYARLFALFHEQYVERLGRRRWGEQLGLIECYADTIFAAYPAAAMLHMIRDPRARLKEALSSARHRHGIIGWDIARWLYSARLASRNQWCYPDRYMVVHYEALADRPEATLRAVCAFLGEDFVPAMLTLEGAIRCGAGADRFDDTPRTPTAGAARLSSAPRPVPRRALAFAQQYARRELLAHGYPLESMRLSLGDWLLYSVVDWPANMAGMAAWRALEATPFARLSYRSPT